MVTFSIMVAVVTCRYGAQAKRPVVIARTHRSRLYKSIYKSADCSYLAHVVYTGIVEH